MRSPVPLPAVVNGTALLQDLSAALARQIGNPEAYGMTLLEAGVPITFAGSSEPCAYVAFENGKASCWGWNGRTFG